MSHNHDRQKHLSLFFYQAQNLLSLLFLLTWEVWTALKKLELLLAVPQVPLTLFSCSPDSSHTFITQIACSQKCRFCSCPQLIPCDMHHLA